jgi:uncharacterized protein (UPF0264 family)
MNDRLFSKGQPPGLLVSVRSAEEAVEAVKGGASVIDIKEPDRGPLGRASSNTWQAIRQVVPASIPVSVALGELSNWEATPSLYAGIRFQKLGLAGAGADWQARWTEIRKSEPVEGRWVAVAYADWTEASSPEPFEVLEAAVLAPDCSGILVDTWNKTKPTPLALTPSWREWVDRAHRGGLFFAIAGGLDHQAMARLSPLKPDLFAVRGAACHSGDRHGTIQADRVEELVRTIADHFR